MLGRAPTESSDYRETIQQTVIGDRKYIRFFGGRGHFAHLRLQLIPRPGELCLVTRTNELEIPQPCYDAARASIFRKLECGPIHFYPMLGLEARLIGGTFLPKYSYAEAFAQAASMAFDEAMLGSSPVVLERCCGFTLWVDPHRLKKTLETLTRFCGEVPARISLDSAKECFVMHAQAPVRWVAGIREMLGLRDLRTYQLPKEHQYRVMTDHPQKGRLQNYPFDDWT